MQACQAVSAAAIGTVLQACGTSPTSPSGGNLLPIVNAIVTGGAVAVALDGGSPLATVGASALVRAPGNEILVTRTSAATAIAVTAICTHESCTITGMADQRFVCPCHGSRYTTEGTVVNGPATRSLRSFATQLVGTTLTINT
jgi:Rieske Fe-S protein